MTKLEPCSGFQTECFDKTRSLADSTDEKHRLFTPHSESITFDSVNPSNRPPLNEQIRLSMIRSFRGYDESTESEDVTVEL